VNLLILLLILVLTVPLAFTLQTYAFWLYERAREPSWDRHFYQISPQGVFNFLAEYLATLAQGFLYVGELFWMAWKAWRRSKKGQAGKFQGLNVRVGNSPRPVILIHGYRVGGLTLCLLARRLRRSGRAVRTPTLGPPWASMKDYLKALGRVIGETLEETGAEKVDLVAHSLGGLVARAYLSGHEAPVARLVTLGAPHLGTPFWVFTWGSCGSAMRPESDFLRSLRGRPLPPGLRAFALYSDFDALVPAPSGSGWEDPGVEKISLSGVGHISLVMRKGAAKAVLQALQA
jgi:pimeloyl-ACP methyl ester carboxylesterase